MERSIGPLCRWACAFSFRAGVRAASLARDLPSRARLPDLLDLDDGARGDLRAPDRELRALGRRADRADDAARLLAVLAGVGDRPADQRHGAGEVLRHLQAADAARELGELL